MPRGYRLLIIASGGIAVLSALGVGAYFGSLYGPDRKHYEAIAGNKPGQNDYQGPSQSLPDIAGLPGPVERAIANPRANTGQDHEKRDLAAQEASALWAFWMVLASFLSVLITAVGTIFLYKQIVLTREAVEDTGRATDAMRKANEISERIGEAQTRCYLGIKSASVSIGDDGNPSVTIVVVNTGQSPARKFRWTHSACWRCGEPEVEWKSRPLSEPPMEYIRDIPVGESPLPNSVQLPGRNLTQAEEFQLAIANIIFVKVVIWMLWEDVFGNKFSERWNFQACHMGGCIDKEVILFPDIMAVERP